MKATPLLQRLAWATPLLLLAACGSGSSGGGTAPAKIAIQVGPSGAVIDGNAGTPLQGFA